MREDLNKLLCERERHGHRNKFHDVRRLKKVEPDDEVAGRESMVKRHNVSWNNKEFNENLTPLWGIVRKNAGRPWDKVYGEICRVFDKRKVINQHILQHLFDFVETKTYIGEDGAVWVRRRWGNPCPVKDSAFSKYYVHPVSGLLLAINKKSAKALRNEREAKQQAEQQKVRRVIDDSTELRKRDDTWFMCVLADFPADRREFVKSSYAKHELDGHWVTRPGQAYDQFERQTVWRTTAQPRYVATIRTASHKELKKHGII